MHAWWRVIGWRIVRLALGGVLLLIDMRLFLLYALTMLLVIRDGLRHLHASNQVMATLRDIETKALFSKLNIDDADRKRAAHEVYRFYATNGQMEHGLLWNLSLTTARRVDKETGLKHFFFGGDAATPDYVE